MKKIITVSLIVILFASCANEKKFSKNCESTKEKQIVLVEPYGVFNSDTKVDGVSYDVSIGNIVWSVILSETIAAPVVFIGWYLYEPIEIYDKEVFDCNDEIAVKTDL